MERCLGCGLTTAVGDRRSLNTAYSNQVIPAWMEIAEATAKDEGVQNVQMNSESSYMCRKCFGAFCKYASLKGVLMENMKRVLTQRSDLHPQDPEVYVGRKRSGEVETSNLCSSKRARLASSSVSRRLEFAPPLMQTSPAVAVR